MYRSISSCNSRVNVNLAANSETIRIAVSSAEETNTLTICLIKHTLSLFHVSNDVNIYVSPFSISVVSFDLVVSFAFYLSDYIVTKSLTSTLFVVLVGLWSGTELELVKIEVY